MAFSAGIAFKVHIIHAPPTGDGPGYNMKRRSNHIFRVAIILGIIISQIVPYL